MGGKFHDKRHLTRADYPRLIEHQIERVNHAFDEGNQTRIINNILGFEKLLSPIKDKEFTDKLTKIKERYDKERKKHIRGLRIAPPSHIENALKFMYFQDKFDALTNLASRMGLLTKMSLVYSDTDDTDDDGEEAIFDIPYEIEGSDSKSDTK